MLETYRVLGQGLAAGLGRLGVAADLVPLVRGRPAGSPAFCFRRAGAYEIAVGGRKLVGSAQRRQRGSFLQHGSVLLGADPARIRAVFPREADPTTGMTTLAGALGRSPGFDAVVEALAAGLAEALGAPLVPGGPVAGRERAGGRARRGQVRHRSLDGGGAAAGRRHGRRGAGGRRLLKGAASIACASTRLRRWWGSAPSSSTGAACCSSSAGGRRRSGAGAFRAVSSTWASRSRRRCVARLPRSAASPWTFTGWWASVDRIIRDPGGRVRYHYVLLDYLATPTAGRAEAGSDALAVQWCEPDALGALDVTDGVESMVRRAFALEAERRREEQEG